MNDKDQENGALRGPLIFTVPAYGFVMALYIALLPHLPSGEITPPSQNGPLPFQLLLRRPVPYRIRKYRTESEQVANCTCLHSRSCLASFRAAVRWPLPPVAYRQPK